MSEEIGRNNGIVKEYIASQANVVVAAPMALLRLLSTKAKKRADF